MKQFIETICIRDALPQHLEWHQRRINATLQHFYPIHYHTWTLEKCIVVPTEFQLGLVRCRILYDAHLLSIHYFMYTPRIINSLKLVETPGEMDYRYKYADRRAIEELYEQRGDADDVLITKDGWITDTSYANIAFGKNDNWYTPSIPLLAGTTWKRLIHAGKLIPQPIHKDQLLCFDVIRIFNAMNDWEDANAIFPENILG